MSQLCTDLPVINRGELLLEPNQKPPFKINDSIRFKCNGTLKPVPNSRIVTCILENDIPTWTSADCRGSCGPPPYIENATQYGNIYIVYSAVIYRCNEGYKMIKYNKTINKHTIYCMINETWSGTNNIRCEHIICPNLSYPENGKVIYNDNYVDTIATYECNEGFRCIGNSVRICLKDGTWSGQEPICEPITCKNPGPYTNGVLLPRDKPLYNVGDIVIFMCNKKDQGTAKCLTTGEWSIKTPICSSLSKSQLSNQTPQHQSKTNSNQSVSSSQSSTINQNLQLSNEISVQQSNRNPISNVSNQSFNQISLPTINRNSQILNQNLENKKLTINDPNSLKLLNRNIILIYLVLSCITLFSIIGFISYIK